MRHFDVQLIGGAVLHKGRITEDGNHDALLNLGGLYAGMFEMQAASYR